jgi:hypothetical protein
LTGKTVVFTGELASLSREEAEHAVKSNGGKVLRVGSRSTARVRKHLEQSSDPCELFSSKLDYLQVRVLLQMLPKHQLNRLDTNIDCLVGIWLVL